MESAEIEEHIKELETRLDRLRALYEQYFMGIERLEPLVPRKDVERRFQLMRKEQIRNTALRFRFQMMLQKYNTYQSYWIRIARQIEEGTYKRDVQRAKAKFEADKRERERGREVDDGPTSFDLTEDFSELGEQLADVLTSSPPGPMRAPATRTPPPVPRATPAPPAPPAGGRAPSSPDLAPEARAAAAAASGPQASVAPSATDGAPRGFGTPPRASQSKMRMLAVRLKAEKEAAAVRAAAAAAPARPSSVPPRPGSSPPRAASERPKPAPVAARPAAASASSPGADAQDGASSAARAPAAPAAAAATARAAAATAQRAREASGSRPDLTDERVRQLYGQYVETRRKQNESTATLTLEGMARTLRESSAKLREKHNGRNVDFEVTVKDGKTVLKPVVK